MRKLFTSMNICVMITSSNKNNQPKWKAGHYE
nr:MAG TPA: hypothetical protein [Caudoviricetes sp.]